MLVNRNNKLFRIDCNLFDKFDRNLKSLVKERMALNSLYIFFIIFFLFLLFFCFSFLLQNF